MSETEKDVRIYELGYWFVPTIAESAVEAQVTELKNKLQSHGVESFIQEEAPYLREISYEMKKVINNQNNYFTEGYFGWMKFEVDARGAKTIEEKLKLDDHILRFILVKTVRENTMVPKKVLQQKPREESAKEDVKEEEKPVLSEAELDKTIEDLVIS